MELYQIEVKETLSRIVPIWADNVKEALRIASDMYHNEEIVLMDKDCLEVETTVYNPDSEELLHQVKEHEDVKEAAYLNKELLDRIHKLASEIKEAGKEIATDTINKDYCLKTIGMNRLIIVSDAGYEAIILGDIYTRHNMGYMYLYSKNSKRRNSYPSIDKLEQLLKQVLLKQTISDKVGTCFYPVCDEYGSLDAQKEFFSHLLKEFLYG